MQSTVAKAIISPAAVQVAAPRGKIHLILQVMEQEVEWKILNVVAEVGELKGWWSKRVMMW